MTDRFDEMLKESPRSGASADFTARVMKRIRDDENPSARPTWRPVFAIAALIVVSILSGITFERYKEVQRIEAIRIEARQLEAELEMLKKQSEEASQVFLGGSEKREFVLDLRDLTAPSPEAQTVSHSF